MTLTRWSQISLSLEFDLNGLETGVFAFEAERRDEFRYVFLGLLKAQANASACLAVCLEASWRHHSESARLLLRSVVKPGIHMARKNLATSHLKWMLAAAQSAAFRFFESSRWARRGLRLQRLDLLRGSFQNAHLFRKCSTFFQITCERQRFVELLVVLYDRRYKRLGKYSESTILGA